MTNKPQDPFDLSRFEKAQAPVMAQVRGELSAGRKRTHWMWFVFPQLLGLGSSDMAIRYGISSAEEARAYLAHAVLGPRLRECTALVLRHAGLSASAIFGNPDDLKFRSSMTLFAEASSEQPFQDALRDFYDGAPDVATVAMLRDAASRPKA